jgi:hypothetical protein
VESIEGVNSTGTGYYLHGAMCSWKVWNDTLVNGALLHLWGGAGIDLPGKPEVGKWYRIEIETKGNNISFYIDDEKIFEREDDSHPSGGVSLWAYDAIVELDNAVITGDDIPDNLSIQPQSKVTTSWGQLKKY